MWEGQGQGCAPGADLGTRETERTWQRGGGGGAGRCELGPWAAVMERKRCFGQRNTHWILEKGSKKVRAVPLGCSGRVSMLEKVGFLLKKDAGCEA